MVLLLVSGVSQKAVIFLIYFLSAPHSSINQNLLKLAFGLMLQKIFLRGIVSSLSLTLFFSSFFSSPYSVKLLTREALSLETAEKIKSKLSCHVLM